MSGEKWSARTPCGGPLCLSHISRDNLFLPSLAGKVLVAKQRAPNLAVGAVAADDVLCL